MDKMIDWETLLTPSPPQVAARSVRRMWQKHVRKKTKKTERSDRRSDLT